ncbi:Transmembrane protein C1orf162 homolog [Vulpes lagopus]
MGGGGSRPEPDDGWGTPDASAGQVLCSDALRSPTGGPSPSPTVATVAAAPTAPQHTAIQHLAFAFLAGVLLTLLLLALVFFIVKCCRKCHSSPWALDPPLDPHSSHDPPAKLSSPEGALTYAKVTFKISEETNNHLTEKHSANLDPVVYAQVKVTDSPYLSNEA